MVDYHSNRTNIYQPLIEAGLISSLFMLALIFGFELRWETNDDIGMSMLAHGYGLIAIGSPSLIFSNVVWGWIVRALPSFEWGLGYAIATLGVLTLTAATVYYWVSKAMGRIAAIALLLLIFIRPILFPQFTINAGFLMVSSLICLHFSAQGNRHALLIFSGLLAWLSYLIRAQEFWLVLFVGAPLIPWQSFLKSKRHQCWLVILVLAAATASILDRATYQQPAWNTFTEVNLARAPLTDFGVGDKLLQRPDLLDRHGYSRNDITLLTSWFFVDPKIADPAKLRPLIAEVWPQIIQRDAVRDGYSSLLTLKDPVVLPGLFAAVLLLILRPSKRLAMIWIAALGTIFAMGLLGRPGILRVYVPLVSLLIVAPLIVSPPRLLSRPTRTSIWIGIYICVGLNVYLSTADSRKATLIGDNLASELQNFPTEPVVLWGAAFPYESVYKVIGSPQPSRNYKLYGLGVATWAPVATSFVQAQEGHGLIERLLSDQGVDLVAEDASISALATYCEERHGGHSELLASRHFGDLLLRTVRCVKNR